MKLGNSNTTLVKVKFGNQVGAKRYLKFKYNTC